MIRDIFCVWVGDKYPFGYVEKLRNMVIRNTNESILFHVITDRTHLPDGYTHHPVPNIEPITGWWNKVRLFDCDLFVGEILYFDLDTVIVNSIDWIFALDTEHVWGIRDYRYLWHDTWRGYNTSVMWFDNRIHTKIWRDFTEADTGRFRGDQDYITHQVPQTHRRFFPEDRFISWRWQATQGGYDFHLGNYRAPNTGTVLTNNTTALIFHGEPNPADSHCVVTQSHWR